jgi:HPt (histidine-containing phosphotransfer) domain-containing protein
LIDTFMKSAPRIVEEMNGALAQGPVAAVAQSAHTLMGSCSNFGAKPLQELCRELETLARQPGFRESAPSMAEAAELLKEIGAELDRVGAALNQYRSKS